MDLKSAIEYALSGEALLFLGAGASASSQNARGSNLPVGSELADEIAYACGEGKNNPLGDIATHFIKNRSESALIKLLNVHLTAVEYPKELESIISLPWIRVWTTNYDNVIDLVEKKVGVQSRHFTTSDKLEDTLRKKRTTVFINGKLDRLTTHFTDDFILTSKDYATNTFVDNEFSRLLKDDLRKSKAVIIIGYTLFDLDIARILSSPQLTNQKIHFIEWNGVGRVLNSKLTDFGSVHSDGLGGLENTIQKVKTYWQAPKYVESYESFSQIIAPDSTTEPSDEEFIKLLTLGHFDHQIAAYQQENPESEANYYLERDFEADCISQLSRPRSVCSLVGSFGSGKTIAAKSIALKLATSSQRDVFYCGKQNVRTNDELLKLCNREKPFVLIIDDIGSKYELLDIFLNNAGNRNSLLVTERSDIYELTESYLESKITVEYSLHHFHVDILSPSEVERLAGTITARGVWKESSMKGESSETKQNYITQDCNRQFNTVLLDILQADSVVKRLKQIADSFNGVAGGHDFLMGLCVLVVNQIDPFYETIEDILNLEYPKLKKLLKVELSRQILTDSNRKIDFQSPIVARHILLQADSAESVTRVIKDMVINSKEMASYDHRFHYYATKFIRYGNISRYLPSQGAAAALNNLYEGIKLKFRRGTDADYWLQYGIARIALEHLDLADQCFENGYSYGEKGINNWSVSQTKQNLDNHSCRLRFMRAEEIDGPEAAYDLIKQSLEVLLRQIRRGNKHYPYRAAGQARTPILKHRYGWTDEKKLSIKAHISEIIDSSQREIQAVKSHYHVIDGVAQLKESLALLNDQ